MRLCVLCNEELDNRIVGECCKECDYLAHYVERESLEEKEIVEEINSIEIAESIKKELDKTGSVKIGEV